MFSYLVNTHEPSEKIGLKNKQQMSQLYKQLVN